MSATTDITSPAEFNDIVVREERGVIVRLSDVAEVELGAEDYESTAWYNGNTALFIGITPTPGANPLDVAELVRKELPKIREQMPGGMKVFVPYDASEFIRDSIDEVFGTLFEAVIIVLLVILLSLGSVRAAIIPAVTLPLCLIGAAFLMMLMGFSINLLTLLAMVLAIGLVVDDAIVVGESVFTRFQKDGPGVENSIEGTQRVAMPVTFAVLTSTCLCRAGLIRMTLYWLNRRWSPATRISKLPLF